MDFAKRWKTKKLWAQEWSRKQIFLSHFFIFHHKSKRMLQFLRNDFWIVIVQKMHKKGLSHWVKMHFSISGHVKLGVVRWHHELDYLCLLWVLSKFGPVEACMCRVIVNWFFPSNGINGPLRKTTHKHIQDAITYKFEQRFKSKGFIPSEFHLWKRKTHDQRIQFPLILLMYTSRYCSPKQKMVPKIRFRPS